MWDFLFFLNCGMGDLNTWQASFWMGKAGWLYENFLGWRGISSLLIGSWAWLDKFNCMQASLTHN